MIISESNAQVKELIKLQKQARHRRRANTFVVEGWKMLAEADKHNLIEKIYLSENIYAGCGEDNGLKNDRVEIKDSVRQLLRFDMGKYPYEVISDMLFRQITETVTPQGVLGIVKMPSYETEDILDDEKKAWLLLDDLRDPGNLGTIMRTAEGAGMSGVIMSRESVDLFNPKVVRSTMGAIFRMPFVYVDNLADTVQRIKAMGYGVYGASMGESVLYDEPDYTEGVAVVIGNEANGISDKVVSALTAGIRIPMEGQLESLNASVAAAVIMYEVSRQRREVFHR